jgi:thymidylate synthase ThyX
MWEKMMDIARAFIAMLASYELTPLEEWLLTPFFTNTRGKVFVLHHLPENMVAVLMAMYSRMNNPRGIRGVFLDNFLPSVLATLMPDCHRLFGGDPQKLLKFYKIKDINDFYGAWPKIVEEFMANFEVDPEYLEQLTASRKMKSFLKTWLDKYGHNSIARVGVVHICFEGISILAAKSLEWNRPGSAFIELSTRYVKMNAAGLYPIWTELPSQFEVEASRLQHQLQRYFGLYRRLQGDAEELDGPFPAFLRQQWTEVVDEKTLEMGVFGETCDVLGNLLPAATLTSVGLTVSGEALPGLIKHLYLDNTPETYALAEAIIAECGGTGAAQFIAHAEVTGWDRANWIYLCEPAETILPDCVWVERVIWSIVGNGCLEPMSLEAYINYLPEEGRGQYGKLSRAFELAMCTFAGTMSYRGWRDMQRMGMATHFRGRMNPYNGFYAYDKPAPKALNEAFGEANLMAMEIWDALALAGVPEQLREYLMPLGILVDYVIAANLRQCEFMNWQRSKPSANHEVRQEFLKIEAALREAYPWWSLISRANTTPAYIFARGSEISLSRE